MKRISKKICVIMTSSLLSFCSNQPIEKKESMKITKTIIPAAGLGTRLLPYTKTIAKEMIALGNKPAIQFIIEEGMHSGVKDFYIIINKEKTQIKNYFSEDPVLENILKENNKIHLLDSVKEIIQNTNLHYIEQHKPMGLGHAILMAQKAIDNEYFSVILPDDIFFGDDPGIAQLISVATQYNASVIAVREVAAEKVSSYGIVSLKATLGDDIFEIAELVEKPSLEKAPSRLAISGRYVLSPRIFDSLNMLLQKHTHGELQLTDAIAHMMKHFGEKIIAIKIKGTLHDLGNPTGWSRAIVDMVQRKML